MILHSERERKLMGELDFKGRVPLRHLTPKFDKISLKS